MPSGEIGCDSRRYRQDNREIIIWRMKCLNCGKDVLESKIDCVTGNQITAHKNDMFIIISWKPKVRGFQFFAYGYTEKICQLELMCVRRASSEEGHFMFDCT